MWCVFFSSSSSSSNATCWMLVYAYATLPGKAKWSGPHQQRWEENEFKYHSVTCYTNSIVSHIRVNTTKLRNITCTLVITSVILQSLKCDPFAPTSFSNAIMSPWLSWRGIFLEASIGIPKSGLDHRLFVPLTLGHINNVMESHFSYGYAFMHGRALLKLVNLNNNFLISRGGKLTLNP